MHTLDGHSDHTIDLWYSPDGSKILTASSDYILGIWCTSFGQSLLMLDQPETTGLEGIALAP